MNEGESPPPPPKVHVLWTVCRRKRKKYPGKLLPYNNIVMFFFFILTCHPSPYPLHATRNQFEIFTISIQTVAFLDEERVFLGSCQCESVYCVSICELDFFYLILFCSWTFKFWSLYYSSFLSLGFVELDLDIFTTLVFFLFSWCLTDSFIYADIFSIFFRCVGSGIVFVLVFVLFWFFLGWLPIFNLSTVPIYIFSPEFPFLIKEDFFSSFLFILCTYYVFLCHQR